MSFDVQEVRLAINSFLYPQTLYVALGKQFIPAEAWPDLQYLKNTAKIKLLMSWV